MGSGFKVFQIFQFIFFFRISLHLRLCIIINIGKSEIKSLAD